MKAKLSHICTLLSLILLGVQPLLAADAIEEIEVQGLRRIEQKTVRDAMATSTGQPLRAERLASDIKRLYGLGYFDDVRTYFNSGTGTLVVKVRERPTIVDIAFEGNKERDAEDLMSELETKKLDFLNNAKIRADKRKLRDFYETKGFYLIQVDHRIEKVRAGEIKLVYRLQEGFQVKVKRINILGNSKLGDDELKSVMRTKEENWLSFITDAGTYKAEIFEQDRAILTQYYGQKGYIMVKVSEPQVRLSADRRDLYLTFTIQEDIQYSVGDIQVGGEIEDEEQDLLRSIQIQTGDVADSIKIRQDVERLSNYYANQGYFYVNVVPRTRTDIESAKVDLQFTVQRGPRTYVERIEISGNTSTRDKVLRREMDLQEGDLFSADGLRSSRFNLERTGYFEEVRITTPRGSSDNKILIRIEVSEKSTGAFSIGAGFNSIESFQVIGQIQKRNLFGLGYDVSLQARLGGRTQTFNLRFVDPYFLDTRIGFNFSAFNTQRQFINFTQSSLGGSFGFSFPLYRRNQRRISLGLNYSLVNEEIKDTRQSIANLFDDGLTSSVTLSLTSDTRNRVFQATKGLLLRGSAEFADGVLIGDNTFAKLLFDASLFVPLITEEARYLPGTTFQLRLNTGYISGLGGEIPLFERFFPGGIQSIRGFEIRSLGPQIQIASESGGPTGLVTEDFPIGGNKQVIINSEVVFPIFRPAGINGVVFFDIGNAFAEGDSIKIADLRESAGFGIRWYSPIGPLRFEWGIPIDKREDESPIVFDFTIGSLF